MRKSAMERLSKTKKSQEDTEKDEEKKGEDQEERQ